jgi:peptide deformylase
MIYPIVAYGDPVLNKVSRAIAQEEYDVKKLADDMFETMYAANGVGLAAPQIGMGIRLFVIDTTHMHEEEELEVNPGLAVKQAFVNAQILEKPVSRGLLKKAA